MSNVPKQFASQIVRASKIQNPTPSFNSSPSLWEGEDIGGGGVFVLNFEHLNFEFVWDL